jgi:hypothetical protein
MLAGTLALAPAAHAANAIVTENARQGTDPSVWQIDDGGSPSILGFATDISVNRGHTVAFKVDTPASDYRLDIYRLGYYGGDGARKVDTVQPTFLGTQDGCDDDVDTGKIDCGNWRVSATWQVPPDATSGIYFAHLVREDGTEGESHIPFVVRDDEGRSDLLFQTSDTTWQAYNQYGGNSLYVGSPVGRALKVSYNRPFTTRGTSKEDWLFNAEYPMVRWLERNGYDVSYSTGVDTDRRGEELKEHKAFLSVGHDEYWSGDQRANVEAARSAGVNLAFFSGNEVFWKTRWEDDHRTLVCYKTTHGTEPDPTGAWTGSWRDGRDWNPEGARPENALTGTIFKVNDGTSAIEVPAAEGKLRFWRNTSVAGLGAGQTATLAAGTLGYEWDEDADNGARPGGLVPLSDTTRDGVEVLKDQGSLYGAGVARHRLTLYRAASGALVFGAGTVQWPWGLDDQHDRGSGAVSPAMQQATVNLFADMGAQPASVQAGLAAATRSTDLTPPTATVTSVQPGNPARASGTAADAGGRVGAVEVSTDGGASWHPAEGRENWTYSWVPPTGGPLSVLVRAADDSGNLSGRVPGSGGGGDGGGGTGGGGEAGGGPGAGPTGGAPTGNGETRGDPGGGGTGTGPTGVTVAGGPDTRAPRVRIRPTRVRASARGQIKLSVTCPAGESRCSVRLRVLRGSRLAGERKAVIAGGQTRTLTVNLDRATRRKLGRARSLRLTAVALTRDAAGNSITTGTRIRVLAPPRS